MYNSLIFILMMIMDIKIVSGIGLESDDMEMVSGAMKPCH